MCDYYTCCRLCLHEAKDGLNCLNVPRFILAIRQIFGFEITTKDKCSTKICQECIGKITNISMYRDFVLNNQMTIEDYQIFRSDILTLKTESIISDEDDVLCENNPSEEPPNITTKVLRKKSPILTKQKQTARKRTGTPFPKWNSSIKLKNLKVVCEKIDYQKDKKKCIIADKKHDVLEAISSNEGVNRLKIIKTVAIGKKGQMTTYKVLGDSPKIIENKTDVNILRNSYKNKRKSVGICYADANREEKPQSPSKVSPQTELIRKEDNGQPEINVSSITEVSPNYNNTRKEISKTNGSPIVERKLLRNRDRQTAAKVYSNNKKNIKTVYKTRQSLANLNVPRQEVEEQEATEVEEKEAKEIEEPEATKDSSNNNTARIEISKTDKETPQSPFEPKLLRKRDQPAKKGYSNSKTINEISQPPVDSNLIKKDAKRQTAKEVSTKNYHASIEVSKTIKETSRSPDVESKLFRKRCKEPPQTKEYSNGKTINETPQPPVDANLFAKEVKEQAATNISTNNNNAIIEIKKTVVANKIRSNFSKQAQPTKKQKLDTDSALVSTQNTAKSTTIINPYAGQKSVINSVSTNIPDLSTSKASLSVATSKPVTIVHELPLTPILKPSVVQTHSTNPSKLTTHASQKAAEILQQNQKDKGLSVSSTYTNTNADSEYVSLESFGRQFGASSVPGPSLSYTTSYNKTQLEKPLYPRFERMYQQQAANQNIQPVATNNITSGIRPMNIDERSQVSTNFNNQPNSKSPPIELNFNKLNNSYLFNPSLNTSSSGNAMHFPYIITVPTSYNSTPTTSYNSIVPTFCNSTAPISNNYTAQSNAPPPYIFTGPTSFNSQTMYSATGPPFSSQQNVNIYQPNIASQYPIVFHI